MDWDKWAKISTVMGTALAALALVVSAVALVITVRETSQTLEANAQTAKESASLQMRSVRLQTNTAAQQLVEKHYAFAAAKGVNLVEDTSHNKVSEEKMDQVAQHGLRAASLVFDLTEGGGGKGESLKLEFAGPTGEFDEMKSFGRLVLTR